MLNISLFQPLNINDWKQYEENFPNCKISFGKENLKTSHIILGNPTIEEIKSCENLQWIQTMSAGVDAYIKGDFPSNIKLTNATGAYGVAISEHMLAMHLSLIKKLNVYRDLQSNQTWESLGTVKSIRNSVVLILGLGDIGSEYAKLVKAMGAYVIGVRRSDITKVDFVDEIHLNEDLDQLLPKADVVAIALPGTEKTKGLINAEKINLMKNGVVILNVGRGPIIDTDSLCDALESGKVSGAGLDVTDPEPLPADHKLWKIPNALITPHISGGFSLEHTRNMIVKLFVDNLQRFINGEELKNLVDFNEGYRKIYNKTQNEREY